MSGSAPASHGLIKVATVDALPHDGMISVVAHSTEIVIARVGETFYALDDWCTHASGLLHQGTLLPETCEVRCPIHSGTFNLRTGLPTRLPARVPVGTYSVTREGDDILLGSPIAPPGPRRFVGVTPAERNIRVDHQEADGPQTEDSYTRDGRCR